MDETWFSDYADELGRCLSDARACAEACEQLLESLSADDDPRRRRTILDAVLGPTAVARVLIDLIDQPPELLLGAARLCADGCRHAVAELEGLDDSRTAPAVEALRLCARSCAQLVDAV